MKNPEKQNIFEVSLGFIDMKNAGVDGKYGLSDIGNKLGYKMDWKMRNRWAKYS